MASIFGQPYESFEEPPTLGSFEAFEPFPRRGPSRGGTQVGQRRPDFVPPPRPFGRPAPEPFVALDREPPSIRPSLSKEMGSFLGNIPYTGSASISSETSAGMSLQDILSGEGSIADKRRLIVSDDDMFGLGNLHREGLLNDFLINQGLQREGRNSPLTFIQNILNRMRLRPSPLLGGRF